MSLMLLDSLTEVRMDPQSMGTCKSQLDCWVAVAFCEDPEGREERDIELLERSAPAAGKTRPPPDSGRLRFKPPQAVARTIEAGKTKGAPLARFGEKKCAWPLEWAR